MLVTHNGTFNETEEIPVIDCVQCSGVGQLQETDGERGITAMKEIPAEVNQALWGIWIVIGLTVLAALGNVMLGVTSEGEFAFTLVLCAFFCVIPYKIRKGSNATRWVFAVLVGLTTLFLVGTLGAGATKLDVVASLVAIPIEFFVLFRLFQPSASAWFNPV